MAVAAVVCSVAACRVLAAPRDPSLQAQATESARRVAAGAPVENADAEAQEPSRLAQESSSTTLAVAAAVEVGRLQRRRPVGAISDVPATQASHQVTADVPVTPQLVWRASPAVVAELVEVPVE